MTKKRILLCWGYHRKGWLYTFNQLSDEFEFHYIFHISRPKEEINFANNSKVHYWVTFRSAKDLISRVRPEKIVFMGLEGINTIALNVEAKKCGIETLVIQHGMYHTYEDYLQLAKEEQKARKKSSNKNLPDVNRSFLLNFFLRSAWNKPSLLYYMARLQYYKSKMLEIEALKKAQSRLRRADKYVVFTHDNASIYYERDGVTYNKMIEVGNPEMDKYFEYEPETVTKYNPYYLLIDQPWSEVREFNSPGFGVTPEQTINFHKKLALYAKRDDCRLLIKLHPYSFASDIFKSHDNIEYLRDVDVTTHIFEAKGVFGFSSTLVLPSIYFNKCCLFKIWDQSSFQNEIEKLQVATVLNFNKFDIDEIEFIEPSDDKLKTFVSKYLYKADGKAISRIRELLHQ